MFFVITPYKEKHQSGFKRKIKEIASETPSVKFEKSI